MQIVPAPLADFAAYRARRDERLASESRCTPITVRPREFNPATIDVAFGEGLDELDAALGERWRSGQRVPRDFDGPAAA